MTARWQSIHAIRGHALTWGTCTTRLGDLRRPKPAFAARWSYGPITRKRSATWPTHCASRGERTYGWLAMTAAWKYGRICLRAAWAAVCSCSLLVDLPKVLPTTNFAIAAHNPARARSLSRAGTARRWDSGDC